MPTNQEVEEKLVIIRGKSQQVREKLAEISQLIKVLRELEALWKRERDSPEKDEEGRTLRKTIRQLEIERDIADTRTALETLGEEVTGLKRELLDLISAGPVIR